MTENVSQGVASATTGRQRLSQPFHQRDQYDLLIKLALLHLKLCTCFALI